MYCQGIGSAWTIVVLLHGRGARELTVTVIAPNVYAQMQTRPDGVVVCRSSSEDAETSSHEELAVAWELVWTSVLGMSPLGRRLHGALAGTAFLPAHALQSARTVLLGGGAGSECYDALRRLVQVRLAPPVARALRAAVVRSVEQRECRRSLALWLALASRW
jgi:hypothetical protein